MRLRITQLLAWNAPGDCNGANFYRAAARMARVITEGLCSRRSRTPMAQIYQRGVYDAQTGIADIIAVSKEVNAGARTEKNRREVALHFAEYFRLSGMIARVKVGPPMPPLLSAFRE